MRIIILVFLLVILSTNLAVSSADMPMQLNNLKHHSEKKPFMMINFIEQQNVNSWRITNDSVMGGESEGRFLVEQGKGTFLGNISLANNGGFSSVFRTIEPISEAVETVTIDILGDGLTYQLRMIVTLDGYRLAYKHNVNTVSGKRQTLSFTLADFQASFRGRIIPNAPILKSKDIREIGFLVTRKSAGEFALSIFSVSF
jgi:hypothetical protein